MRTTVTLDADVELMIRDRMVSKGVSFKQALNDSIREGRLAGERQEYSTPVFEMGTAGFDLTKALQVAGELEDEELIGHLRRGA
jgi:hypothetical protein